MGKALARPDLVRGAGSTQMLSGVRNRDLNLVGVLAFPALMIHCGRSVKVGCAAYDRSVGKGGIGMRRAGHLGRWAINCDPAVHVVTDHRSRRGMPCKGHTMGCDLRSITIEDGVRTILRVAHELNTTGDLSCGLGSECDLEMGALASRNGQGKHNAGDRESGPTPVGRSDRNTGIAGGQSGG